jgi:processive 1,2-diacylglycerol beta-glucosyltransferase
VPVRVLILSMSMGGGHTRAGEAVARQLALLDPAADIRIVDTRGCLSAALSVPYVGGYLLVSRHLPFLWGLLYDHPILRRGGTVPRRLLWHSMRRLRALVRAFRPHVALATQVTAAEAAALLAERGELPAAAAVVTDYDSHPCWRLEGIDRFFVADEAVLRGMVAMGIPRPKLMASGIPVHEEFERPCDRRQLRNRLGLDADAPTVLLMGGAQGLGRMVDQARELLRLPRPLQIVAVAGRNVSLQRALRRLVPPEGVCLDVLGYVGNVHDWMRAADVLVSKAGGVSMAEALQSGVPTVTVDVLRGQEAVNSRHLSEAGCVRTVPRGVSVAAAVAELLGDAACLRETVNRYRKPSSAMTVAAEIVRLAQSSAGACRISAP